MTAQPTTTDPSAPTASTATSVSVSRLIPATAQRLFDLVADPTMHPVIDGSGSVRGVKGAKRKLALGDRFTANMRVGLPYFISNTVVEYAEGRRFAWAHVGGWRWRWEFEEQEPVDGEPITRVTETFDWSTAKAAGYVTRLGWPEKNRTAMERSLNRLATYIAHTSQPL
ncbi:SRPBCC family protein [Dermatobacter hominis]|uniref:SRPBCC family protein n=1 Tax=Dermatobacter hominis TaxID=2884263 RepID=UPI001D1214E8|nr:SRPBCC family protein [Dermatobacter hominis]UDY35535.1 SRPBCC family protein [Dermatobacter hominis]